MQLQRAYPDLQTRGLGLAAISYDSVATLKAFADKHGITYPLLSDAGSGTIKRYHLLNASATGVAAGIPYPGTFVLDARGVVLSRSFEENYQNRETAASVLANLPVSHGRSAAAPADRWIETPHLRILASASDEVAAPGETITLVADVEPKPKMHVYAPGQPDYIPVSLDLAQDASLTSEPPHFPPAEHVLFAPLNEQQLVYAKPFRITERVTLALSRELRQQAAAGGRLTIAGTLRYQACDDKVCYIPAKVPVQWTVKLAPMQ